MNTQTSTNAPPTKSRPIKTPSFGAYKALCS